MQFETQIKAAKHLFEPEYDESELRSNVLKMIPANKPMGSRKSLFNHRKSKAWLIGIVVLPLIVGFAYVSFNWHSSTFRFIDKPITKGIDTETIVHSFHHPQPNTRKLTLTEARFLSGFPIHEPLSIQGWKRIESTGLGYQVPATDKSGAGLKSHEEIVVYMDEYKNSTNQTVLVLQQVDNGLSATNQIPFAHPTIHFPSNSEKILLGKNLGVFIPSTSGKENFLHVYDSIGNQVTDIEIYGKSKSAMLMIATAYLKAPTH